jgi:hypothetical protein
MLVSKATAGVAFVLVSMSVSAATSSSHTQFHSRYPDASHYRTAKVSGYKIPSDKVQSGKGLPRSTVAPSPAATAGSVKTHVSEVDRLERQNSFQLTAERKHEGRMSASPSHVAHNEPSGRASSINFSYHSPQRVQTSRSSGSGNRKP